MVLSLDEMTSLQPRPRRVATRPAQPGRPLQVEHEYRRAGATHLFAAFDTRSGQVYGVTTRRKRQVEYLTLLEHLDHAIPASVTTIHLLADNVSVHHGKLVQHWLAAHPRFVAHFTPVHCSWMNPVEQWFGILRRKRLRSPNFADLRRPPARHPPVHRRVERDRSSLPLDRPLLRQDPRQGRRRPGCRRHHARLSRLTGARLLGSGTKQTVTGAYPMPLVVRRIQQRLCRADRAGALLGRGT